MNWSPAPDLPKRYLDIMAAMEQSKIDRPWLEHYNEGVSPSVSYPDKTVFQLLEEAAAANPNGLATRFFGAGFTYRRLLSAVDRFAGALSRMGVRKGDRVALILPNMPAYPVAHFAVLQLGGILVPTNPLYVERELEHQLNSAEAETVVVLDQIYSRLAKVQENTSVRRVIVVRIQDFLPRILSILYGLKHRGRKEPRGQGIHLYRKLMRQTGPPKEAFEVGPDDTAILLYTGGTTGVSKGAVLTHRNLVTNVFQTRQWIWSIQEGKEVFLCVLPFFHSYGMTTGMHLAVHTQSTMILLPRFELADVMKQIKKYRPTIFCAVPSMYNAINRYPKVSNRDVGSIRVCISGGAGLPAEVQKRFEELTGGSLVEGYGLSETSPVALVNPIVGNRKTGTIGIPVSDTDARVVDPETKEPLPGGQVGELALRGPQVMQGYWGMPEETKQVLRDGWLYTGDLSEMDEEGFFSIVDRKKDLIISAGMNIYPREVEEVLHQHPKIVEAAVVGIPSKVRQETVKAFVVVEEGQELTKSEVIQFCQDKLSRYKIPKRIEFMEELPKSALGKVLKRVLKNPEDS